MRNVRFILGAVGIGLALPSAALDFQSNGNTLKTLVPKLSEATGLKLSVATPFENMVVVARATKAEPTDFLNRIAAASGLTWVKADDGFRLDRLPESATAEYQNYVKFSSELWQSWRENPPTNGNNVDDVMLAFNPAELAQIVIGGRVVYSDRRNGNQLQMSPGVLQAVRERLDGQQATALTELDRRIAAETNQQRRDRILPFRERIATPIAKRLVTIYRNGLTSYSVSVTALDNEGNPRFNNGGQYRITPTNPQSTPIIGNPISAELKAKLNAFTQVGQTANPYRSEIRNIITNPAANEPAAFAVGPTLLAAIPESQNFVAVIPDESLIPLANSLEDSGLAGIAAPSNYLTTAQEEGWITIKPRLLTHAWITQRDRAALGRVTTELVQTGVIRLATQIAYASTVSEVHSNPSWENYLTVQLIGAGAASQLSTFNGTSLEGLQLLGALGNRATAQERVELPSSALNTAFINPLLFNSPSGPSRVVSNGNITVIDNRTQEQDRNGRSNGERTEYLANTPPNGGTITITTERRNAIIARTQDGTTQVPLSERDLAGLRASQLSGGIRSRFGDIAGSINQFGMSESIRISIAIQYPDGTRFTRRVSATEPAQSFGDYSELPANIQEETNRRANEYVQRATRDQERRQRRNTPPPQP